MSGDKSSYEKYLKYKKKVDKLQNEANILVGGNDEHIVNVGCILFEHRTENTLYRSEICKFPSVKFTFSESSISWKILLKEILSKGNFEDKVRVSEIKKAMITESDKNSYEITDFDKTVIIGPSMHIEKLEIYI